MDVFHNVREVENVWSNTRRLKREAPIPLGINGP
jgi:hypothetical protein